ncbi:putative Chitin binding Peritrophin-A domain-containing protein 17 [Homarus americanus]|uniref:Putative Chitin binding Peritrophin-A domain-containing protein 17 n=1 Tax=Homarus americanus TaxID=6706 RepID=A0A8J5MV67_HOMAM|nr:putative Chitin binding Peritrophin-A domain-containing protein 17 [Homarus americanus]
MVVVAGVAAYGQGMDQPPTFECHEDGYFPDYFRSCYVYYKCYQGTKTTYGCEEGKAYDVMANDCLPADAVSCPYPVQ